MIHDAEPLKPTPAAGELLEAHRALDQAAAAADAAFRLARHVPAAMTREAQRALDQAEADLERARRRLQMAREALEALARGRGDEDEKDWGAH